MIFSLIAFIAAGMWMAERLWPAAALPTVARWWPRIVVVNAVQAAVVVVAGLTWDRWLQGYSLCHLRDHLGPVPAALAGYVVVTLVYYFWHRVRHESVFFWRLCHQLHHSPRRLEVVMSFYKHPVEILLNSLLSAAIAIPLLGCSPASAALITLITAVSDLLPLEHSYATLAGLFFPEAGVASSASQERVSHQQLQ